VIPRDTLAARVFLAAARQRNGLDEPRCRLVFEFLSTAASINAALRSDLATIKLTELKLGVLVVLFAVDPATATPADLAAHTGATRSAMTDVLDQLQDQAFVTRERDSQDRRLVHVHLTESGRAAADAALSRYLNNVGRAAQFLEPNLQEQLLLSCNQLNKGSASLALENNPPFSA
jgi:DNA-binding MarR family transcriptional regulator